MAYNFDCVISNAIVRFNIPSDYLKEKVRDCNLKIKAHPRIDRPNTQQIYINNKYFMYVPCAVYLEDEDLQDPSNFYGNEFIFIISELYKMGYDLNKIKSIISTEIKQLKKDVRKPQY